MEILLYFFVCAIFCNFRRPFAAASQEGTPGSEAGFLVGAWGECLLPCRQHREVICVRGDHYVGAEECSGLEWPAREQNCVGGQCLGNGAQNQQILSSESTLTKDSKSKKVTLKDLHQTLSQRENFSKTEEIVSLPTSQGSSTSSHWYSNYVLVGSAVSIFMGLTVYIIIRVRQAMQPKSSAYLYYQSQYDFDNPFCDISKKYEHEKDITDVFLLSAKKDETAMGETGHMSSLPPPIV
eukprot:CAMPEP_0117752832 /NCGR_PEP_ID=MMETSP0947-20121206/11860_1 /TAXON_ID=44440 /ORGANISM="Chattonella subsalsa, Strain CCMP2191" /LENGTH=237 /DNA_ID=CAMNT_0005571589 /DNA_START=115 /DNA_END=828 /DNA_ORIENTATION=-